VLKHAQGNKKNASKDEIVHLYREMCQIRIFEETVLENFPKGVFFGTTHTYLGQEANAVGVFDTLEPGDIVFSNHRCHGHFLAYGGDMRALFAEMMGKSTGVCGGRGGSQHLQISIQMAFKEESCRSQLGWLLPRRRKGTIKSCMSFSEMGH